MYPEEASKDDARMAQIDGEAAARRDLHSRDPKSGQEFWICKGVQEQVEATLKAPATADFQSCVWHQSQVTYAGNGHYTFSSWVDAANSFGAQIRTYYDGEALIDDQSLRTHRFQITRLSTH
jgi:hypothetical protein